MRYLAKGDSRAGEGRPPSRSWQLLSKLLPSVSHRAKGAIWTGIGAVLVRKPFPDCRSKKRHFSDG